MPTLFDEFLAGLLAVLAGLCGALAWFVRRIIIQNDDKHALADKRHGDILATLASIDGGLTQIHQRQENHEAHDDERFTRGEKSFERTERALIVIQSDIKELLKR